MIIGRYDTIPVYPGEAVFALKYLHYRNKIKHELEFSLGGECHGRMYMIDYKKKSFLRLMKKLRKYEVVRKHYNSGKISEYLRNLIQGSVTLENPIIKKYDKELTKLLKTKRR